MKVRDLLIIILLFIAIWWFSKQQGWWSKTAPKKSDTNPTPGGALLYTGPSNALITQWKSVFTRAFGSYHDVDLQNFVDYYTKGSDTVKGIITDSLSSLASFPTNINDVAGWSAAQKSTINNKKYDVAQVQQINKDLMLDLATTDLISSLTANIKIAQSNGIQHAQYGVPLTIRQN